MPATDPLLAPEVGELLDAVAGAFGLLVGFATLDGRHLLTGRGPGQARFCQLLRRDHGQEDRCQACDRQHLASARAAGRAHVYRCHAGLIEALVPVRTGQRTVGFLWVGQFRDQRPLDAALARQDPRLAAAYGQLPLVETARQRHLVRLLELLVDRLHEHHLVTVRRQLEVERALALIEADPQANPGLAAMAARLGLAPATLSRRFRRATGRGFKATVIIRKLDLAERLLREDPALTVAAVAERLGFCDPLHFSRLFKRHRGVPPSQVRQDARAGR